MEPYGCGSLITDSVYRSLQVTTVEFLVVSWNKNMLHLRKKKVKMERGRNVGRKERRKARKWKQRMQGYEGNEGRVKVSMTRWKCFIYFSEIPLHVMESRKNIYNLMKSFKCEEKQLRYL